MKNKHMKNHDRIIIENGLNSNLSFKAIASKIGKDCTTISKEVKLNFTERNIAFPGRMYASPTL